MDLSLAYGRDGHEHRVGRRMVAGRFLLTATALAAEGVISGMRKSGQREKGFEALYEFSAPHARNKTRVDIYQSLNAHNSAASLLMY